MRKSLVVVGLGGLLLTLPAAALGQEKAVSDVHIDSQHQMDQVSAAAEPSAETADAPKSLGEPSALATLRRAEAEFAMSGEDVKELAVGPDGLEAATVQDSVEIPTTTIIIALLVLIVILVA